MQTDTKYDLITETAATSTRDNNGPNFNSSYTGKVSMDHNRQDCILNHNFMPNSVPRD